MNEPFPGSSDVTGPSISTVRARIAAKIGELAEAVNLRLGDATIRGLAFDLMPLVNALTPSVPPVNLIPLDPHAEDFHVYIDGALRYRVPCGVCGGKSDSQADIADHDERKRLYAGYGVKSPALREGVRARMESLLSELHPDSQVSVR